MRIQRFRRFRRFKWFIWVHGFTDSCGSWFRLDASPLLRYGVAWPIISGVLKPLVVNDYPDARGVLPDAVESRELVAVIRKAFAE
jgi:hypothetical protein